MLGHNLPFLAPPSPIFMENLLINFSPIARKCETDKMFHSNIFPAIHAHISICVALLVLATMQLLTNNRAEPIPSPGNRFRRSLSLSFPATPVSPCHPEQKLLCLLLQHTTLTVTWSLRKGLLRPADKSMETVTRNQELECLWKNLVQMKSIRVYTTNNTHSKELVSPKLYSLLGKGIRGGSFPSLSLTFSTFWQLML